MFGQNLTERVEKAEKTDEDEHGEQEGRSSQETEDEAAETAVEAGDKSLFSGVSTAGKGMRVLFLLRCHFADYYSGLQKRRRAARRLSPRRRPSTRSRRPASGSTTWLTW